MFNQGLIFVGSDLFTLPSSPLLQWFNNSFGFCLGVNSLPCCSMHEKNLIMGDNFKYKRGTSIEILSQYSMLVWMHSIKLHQSRWLYLQKHTLDFTAETADMPIIALTTAGLFACRRYLTCDFLWQVLQCLGSEFHLPFRQALYRSFTSLPCTQPPATPSATATAQTALFSVPATISRRCLSPWHPELC